MNNEQLLLELKLFNYESWKSLSMNMKSSWAFSNAETKIVTH